MLFDKFSLLGREVSSERWWNYAAVSTAGGDSCTVCARLVCVDRCSRAVIIEFLHSLMLTPWRMGVVWVYLLPLLQPLIDPTQLKATRPDDWSL